MNYEYKCDDCKLTFIRTLPIAQRNIPLEEPCPDCGLSSICRIFGITIVSESMDLHTRAERVGGDAYKEVMRSIKKSGGKFGKVNI